MVSILVLISLVLASCTTNEIQGAAVRMDLMADAPCHIMSNTIMGDCSDEDIVRLQEALENMPTGPKKEIKLFSAGEGIPLSELPAVQSSEVIRVRNNEKISLDARIITKEIKGATHKMYAYNGQLPGPTLILEQGSTAYIEFTNNIDLPTTVHWRGLRLENAMDGVPKITQPVVMPGESFLYKLDFPDEGVYWYHSHVRGDIQRDLGLNANILVTPRAESYYNEVNQEELLVLDDILIEDGEIVPYGKEHANFAVMGRFGNVMLTNGKEDYELIVKKGDVVRFYVTNIANVRPFNLSFDGARIKLVGSDVGNYERDEFVDSILITTAERYVVEVLFDEVREYKVLHTTPDKIYTLGKVKVLDQPLIEDYSLEFNTLHENKYIVEDIDKYREYFDQPVDYQIDLTVDIPDLIRLDKGRLHGEGIEWEDVMGEVNAQSTSEDVTWIIKDKVSGEENMDIDYNFKVGDIVKMRIFNDPDSQHPMQHYIHLHGQRFLVLEENEVRKKNLVWKDTLNVPTGSTIDILLDVTNPGEWLAHCHISEHVESGMKFTFKVGG